YVAWPCVRFPLSSLFLSALFAVPFLIRAAGELHGCDRPAGHDGVVYRLPVALKLIEVSLILQYRPRVIDHDVLCTFQEVVRNLRSSIRKAFPFPFRGQEDKFLTRNGLRAHRQG